MMGFWNREPKPRRAKRWITSISFHKDVDKPWTAWIYLDHGDRWWDYTSKTWKMYGPSGVANKDFTTSEEARAWLDSWGEEFAAIVAELKEKEVRSEYVVQEG